MPQNVKIWYSTRGCNGILKLYSWNKRKWIIITIGEQDGWVVSLQWLHNERDGRLFRRRSKKTSKLRVTGLCEGNSPVTGEFPPQRASNVENVSIWWRHHENPVCTFSVLQTLLLLVWLSGMGFERKACAPTQCWVEQSSQKDLGHPQHNPYQTYLP